MAGRGYSWALSSTVSCFTITSWHTRIFHSNGVESTHNDKRDKQTLWRRRRLTTLGFSQIAISTAFIFKVITSQRTGCGNCRKRSRLSVLKWCHIFLFQNLRLKRFAFREITMWQKWRPEIWHAPTVRCLPSPWHSLPRNSGRCGVQCSHPQWWDQLCLEFPNDTRSECTQASSLENYSPGVFLYLWVFIAIVQNRLRWVFTVFGWHT